MFFNSQSKCDINEQKLTFSQNHLAFSLKRDHDSDKKNSAK